jgi:invasion protein IalB
MTKQTILSILFLIFVAAGAAWFMNPFGEPSGGTAVAAETENEPAKNTASAEGKSVEPWQRRCSKQKVEEKEVEHCEIFQTLTMKENGKRFAEFAIGYPPDTAEARGIMILPLGSLLDTGVKMQIDEGRLYQFTFRYCLPSGCYAVLKLTSGIIDEMKKGTNAKIEMISVENKKYNVPFTLSGFTKAIDSVKK